MGRYPNGDRPIRKELVRIESFVFCFDKPDFQPIGSSENAAADSIEGSVSGFVFNQDLPGGNEIRGRQDRLDLLNVQFRRHR